MLLAKLLKRRNAGSLTTAELSQILDRFLENHAFQLADPWKAFLEQFKPEELPQIHQVYAVLGRYVEAAELAEAARDYRSAICYPSFVTFTMPFFVFPKFVLMSYIICSSAFFLLSGFVNT